MNLFPPTNTPSPAQVNAAPLILRIVSAPGGAGTVCRRVGDFERRSDPTWRGVRHRRHARSDLFGAPPTRLVILV
jgi:hypothetical protein